MPKHSRAQKSGGGGKKHRHSRKNRHTKRRHQRGGGCGCGAAPKLFFGGGNPVAPIPATLLMATQPIPPTKGGLFSGGAPGVPVQRGGGWFGDFLTNNYLINSITGTYTTMGMSGTNSILAGTTPVNSSPAFQGVEFYGPRNPRLA